MGGDFLHIVRDRPDVPLAWAGGTLAQDYLNLGDALSPVMTALIAGKPVSRAPFLAESPRLVAVGTIGQNIHGGAAWFWGTGCSHRRNMRAGVRRFSAGSDTVRHVAATRGPISAALLGGGRLPTDVFCDPVWLLPRFYDPGLPKTHELGVILHLSELRDRDVECHPYPEFRALDIPSELQGVVRLINTVSECSAEGLRQNLDEILSCKRIVSTSLHGLVFAESYGIPCLYFPKFGPAGPDEDDLDFFGRVDLRIADLYLGAGRERLSFYRQPREEPTDWADVIRAIDALWTPAEVDVDALVEAFPADVRPLSAPPGGAIWDHPVICDLPFAADPKSVMVEERARVARTAQAGRDWAAKWSARLARHRLPAAAIPASRPRPVRRMRIAKGENGRARIPVFVGSQGHPERSAETAGALVAAAISGAPAGAGFLRADTPALVMGDVASVTGAGAAHVWGGGVLAPDAALPDAPVVVHAARGPYSAMRLRHLGIDADEAFGHPAFLLPRLLDVAKAGNETVGRQFELGVFVGAGVARLEPPPDLAGRVRVLQPPRGPRLEGLRACVRDMLACRAVIAAEPFGAALAFAFGVPHVVLVDHGVTGYQTASTLMPDGPLGFGLADLYAGQGLAETGVFVCASGDDFDWELALEGAPSLAPPPAVDVAAYFEAFPAGCAVGLDGSAWTLPGRPETPDGAGRSDDDA